MNQHFDPQCYELAKLFCPEGTAELKVINLASGIQDYIEDWLSHEEREAELKRLAGDWRAK